MTGSTRRSTADGGQLSESVYDRWWKLARERALTETHVVSPLVRRPYDLRHAAASLWLNAGVPPPPRSPGAWATASPSCFGSTPTASTGETTP